MRILNISGKKIMVYNDGQKIENSNSIADLMVKANSECNAWLVALDKNMISSAMFDLQTGLADEFLQKVKFHSLKIAIFGDFSDINLKDFKKYLADNKAEKIILLTATRQEAVKILQEM